VCVCEDLTPSDKVPDRQRGANHQTLLALLIYFPDPSNHPGDELPAGLVILRFIPQDIGVLLLASHLNNGFDDASLAILKASFVRSTIGIIRPPRRILPTVKEIKHIRQARDSIMFVGEG